MSTKAKTQCCPIMNHCQETLNTYRSPLILVIIYMPDMEVWIHKERKNMSGIVCHRFKKSDYPKRGFHQKELVCQCMYLSGKCNLH